MNENGEPLAATFCPGSPIPFAGPFNFTDKNGYILINPNVPSCSILSEGYCPFDAPTKNFPLIVTMKRLPSKTTMAKSRVASGDNVNVVAEGKAIDISIVFQRSKAYEEIRKRNPDQRLQLLEEARTGEWLQLAIVEDHPTHVVTLERLRVRADGRIERLSFTDDGEEVWLRDDKPNEKQSQSGPRD